jgi:hypothetical protein
MTDRTPGQWFAIKVGIFVLAILVCVLAYALIGHTVGIIIFVLALVAFVARKVLIYRMTAGDKKL